MRKNTRPSDDEPKPTVAKSAVELQRFKLEKLMKNPEKPVVIPDRPKDKKTPHVPEFVRNVMGSSAGAGSGEFHVYRHLRRKEYARQKFIQEKSEKQLLEEAYHQKLLDNKQATEEKTAKKRAKRLRKKANKRMKKQNPSMTKKDTKSESESEDSSVEDQADDRTDPMTESNKRTIVEGSDRTNPIAEDSKCDDIGNSVKSLIEGTINDEPLPSHTNKDSTEIDNHCSRSVNQRSADYRKEEDKSEAILEPATQDSSLGRDETQDNR